MVFISVQTLILGSLFFSYIIRIIWPFTNFNKLMNRVFPYLSAKLIKNCLKTVIFIFDNSSFIFRIYCVNFILYVLIGYAFRSALLKDVNVLFQYWIYFVIYFFVGLVVSFWITFSVVLWLYMFRTDRLLVIGPEVTPPDIDVNLEVKNDTNITPPPNIQPKLNVPGNAWNGGNAKRIIERLKTRGKIRLACDVIGLCAITLGIFVLHKNTIAIEESNSLACETLYQSKYTTLLKEYSKGLISKQQYDAKKASLEFEQKYKKNK